MTITRVNGFYLARIDCFVCKSVSRIEALSMVLRVFNNYKNGTDNG